MENMNGRKRVEEGELCDRRNGDWSISHKLITTGSCYANMVFIYISLWQEEELISTEIGVLTGERKKR
jgi:hypothetical protein